MKFCLKSKWIHWIHVESVRRFLTPSWICGKVNLIECLRALITIRKGAEHKDRCLWATTQRPRYPICLQQFILCPPNHHGKGNLLHKCKNNHKVRLGEVNKVLQEIRPHLMHSAQSNSVCVCEWESEYVYSIWMCVCVWVCVAVPHFK